MPAAAAARPASAGEAMSAGLPAGGRSRKAENSPPSWGAITQGGTWRSWPAITPRLAGQRAQRLRALVVAAVDDDPAQVEPAQLGEDRRGEVLALEADQEQLRHLALQRQPPHQVADGARHARSAGGARVGRGRHDPRQERGVALAPRLDSRLGNLPRALLVALARNKDPAGGGDDRHGQQQDADLHSIGRERLQLRQEAPQSHRDPRLVFEAVPDAAPTVVMKFGGTSVADAARIKRAAGRIVALAESGTRVVAVLSARGKTTDDLVAMAHEVSPRPHPREMDMLLSTGERISCALAAMVINDLGHEAISLTGSQAGIVTDTSHTRARILDIKADRIRAGLDDGKIVLVAGFQGVSTSSDVTTLGRGGSDTTAVALAAALGAEVCEIYTDVAGVFSADPRIVPDAKKLPVVTFEEMLEMSASGAGVLQLRSVEYARNHAVSIHCRSSFEDRPGTVVEDEARTMERPLITAVTHSTAEARVTLLGLPDRPGIAGRVLSALADAGVNVDMIIQNEPVTEGQSADMSVTVPRDDLANARSALEGLQGELGFAGVQTDESMGKVSLVGAGMRSHPGVAAKALTTLGHAGVNIEMISTSPIKISCVVREEHVETAVRELHAAFELGADAVRREDVSGVHRPVVT